MFSRERIKPLLGVGAVVATVLIWVFAFRTGSAASSEWSQEEWRIPSDTRGKGVYLGNKLVETPTEKEKRLEKEKILHGELGAIKKSVIGGSEKIRGNDIVPERPPPPPGFDFNPRDACLQMKMEYPDRYANVDCMSDRYDSSDPWWELPRNH